MANLLLTDISHMNPVARAAVGFFVIMDLTCALDGGK